MIRRDPIPGDGQLRNLENFDNRIWSYRFEPAAQTIWIMPPQDTRGNIAANGGLTLRMAWACIRSAIPARISGPSVVVGGARNRRS